MDQYVWTFTNVFVAGIGVIGKVRQIFMELGARGRCNHEDSTWLSKSYCCENGMCIIQVGFKERKTYS